MYQVSFNSLLYVQIYAPDKLFYCKIRIPRIGCVVCLKCQPFDMKKEKKTLVFIIAPIPKGNPSLQTSNEINVSLQKLLKGNNIFTLYFTPTIKTKSKKGHNLAKILRMITNIELDLYFTMIYPSANFQ